jgi:hypothetical protein
MDKSIEEKLLQLTPLDASIVVDVVWGYDSIMSLTKKYKKPRTYIYNLMNVNEALIKEMREEKIKRIETDLENMVIKAIDVYHEILSSSDKQLKEKVATNILKGRGKLTENLKQDLTVSGNLTINRPKE